MYKHLQFLGLLSYCLLIALDFVNLAGFFDDFSGILEGNKRLVALNSNWSPYVLASLFD
jgi:hypothetical protein